MRERARERESTVCLDFVTNYALFSMFTFIKIIHTCIKVSLRIVAAGINYFICGISA